MMNQKTETGLTAEQALKRVIEIVKYMAEMQKEGVHGQIKDLRGVSFAHMPLLYGVMVREYGSRVRWFMNGDLDTEGLLIVYCPCIGCTINIESEPCVDLGWRMKNKIHPELNWQ